MSALERLQARFTESPHPLLTDTEFADLRAVLDEQDADVRAVAGLLKLGDVSFLGSWLTAWEDARSALEACFADRIAGLEARDAKTPPRCVCGCPKVGDGCTCHFCDEPYPTGWLADPAQSGEPTATHDATTIPGAA